MRRTARNAAGTGEGTQVHDHPLRAALRNEVYEFLGRQHSELLSSIRRQHPNIGGAGLALAALRQLHPDSARNAEQVGADHFFRRWIENRGGELPRIRIREQLMPALSTSEDHTMELRWLGLAILVAAAGGAFLWLLARSKNPETSLPPSPQPAKPQPVRFAAAAFSGKVRDAGTAPESAGDLLTQATYWWVGSADAWSAVTNNVPLTRIDTVPDTDDALVVVAYETARPPSGIPSSRPEGATRLRDAAREHDLRFVGMFSVEDPSLMTNAGFRR
jgi:hypothetical protein